MQTIKKIISVLLVVLTFSFYNVAYAAWGFIQTFNSLTTAALSGQTCGGVGSTGNWSGASATMTVETSVVYEGAKAVSATANGDMRCQMSPAVSAGTLYIAFRASDVSSLVGYVVLEKGSGTARMAIMLSAGTLNIYDNTAAGYVNVGSYTANAWHVLAIDFDAAAHANQYRVAIDGGTYSAYKTVVGGTYSDVDFLRMERDGVTNTFYWDDITNTNPIIAAANFSWWQFTDF